MFMQYRVYPYIGVKQQLPTSRLSLSFSLFPPFAPSPTLSQNFCMTRNDYVVYGEMFGEKECLTAMTPNAQYPDAFLPGMSIYIFGDSWVRSFYTVFELIPLKRVGFLKADHRYE